jgi:HK97 gp10 family phage protein
LISLNVHGLKDLQMQLEELRDVELAAKTLASAARKAFKPVLEAAQSRAPVDTGVLRDSIKIAVKKPKNGDAVVVVGLRIAKDKTAAARTGRKNADASWRWHFVELGTRFQGSRPFLRPALDGNAQAVVEALKTELAKGIQRVVRKRARAAAGV